MASHSKQFFAEQNNFAEMSVRTGDRRHEGEPRSQLERQKSDQFPNSFDRSGTEGNQSRGEREFFSSNVSQLSPGDPFCSHSVVEKRTTLSSECLDVQNKGCRLNMDTNNVGQHSPTLESTDLQEDIDGWSMELDDTIEKARSVIDEFEQRYAANQRDSRQSSIEEFNDFASERSREKRDRRDRRRRRHDDTERDFRYPDESPGRRNEHFRSSGRGYSDKNDCDTDRNSSDFRGQEQNTYREEAEYGNDSEYRDRRRKRRSRSRDRNHSRRYSESERDRRYRRSDRDRRRRDRNRDRDGSRSPREVPWVPPPLPEHLRHLTKVPWVPPPLGHDQEASSARMVPPPLQNQFQNDGSFLELFRQQMQAANTTQQSEDSNISDGTGCSTAATAISTTDSATTATVLPSISSGVPVIAKRRISKILKTGVVQKPKKAEADTDSDGMGSSAWSRYMSEVQRYRANKCIEDESSRPLMK